MYFCAGATEYSKFVAKNMVVPLWHSKVALSTVVKLSYAKKALFFSSSLVFTSIRFSVWLDSPLLFSFLFPSFRLMQSVVSCHPIAILGLWTQSREGEEKWALMSYVHYVPYSMRGMSSFNCRKKRLLPHRLTLSSPFFRKFPLPSSAFHSFSFLFQLMGVGMREGGKGDCATSYAHSVCVAMLKMFLWKPIYWC